MKWLDLIADKWRWPRKIMCGSMTRGQIIIKSEEELLECVEAASGIDCFIQSNSNLERDSYILDVLMIDIDNLQDLKLAERQAMETSDNVFKIFSIRPHVQFSGYKGYHILIPFIINPFKSLNELKSYMSYLQDYLSCGVCDPQIRGDLVRLFRIPESINSKGVRGGGDGIVRVVQWWDGNRADSRVLYSQFSSQIMKKSNVVELVKNNNGIRQTVEHLIENALMGVKLNHREHLIILFELIARGWSDEEISNIFSRQEDFDRSKTLYFIRHARRKGYKPYSNL